MKKETRKERDDRELKFLTETGLSDAELKVVRKLNGATSVPGYPVEYKKRTIEAVLQGRRSNPRLLQAAIQNAKKELEHLTKVMNELLSKLN